MAFFSKIEKTPIFVALQALAYDFYTWLLLVLIGGNFGRWVFFFFLNSMILKNCGRGCFLDVVKISRYLKKAWSICWTKWIIWSEYFTFRRIDWRERSGVKRMIRKWSSVSHEMKTKSAPKQIEINNESKFSLSWLVYHRAKLDGDAVGNIGAFLWKKLFGESYERQHK